MPRKPNSQLVEDVQCEEVYNEEGLLVAASCGDDTFGTDEHVMSVEEASMLTGCSIDDLNM